MNCLDYDDILYGMIHLNCNVCIYLTDLQSGYYEAFMFSAF